MENNLQNTLKSYLLSQERIEHSVRVANLSVELAKVYYIEQIQAYTAGLFHDIAKDITYEKSIQLARTYNYTLTESEIMNKKLLHAPIGALLAKFELGIENDDIINAIRWHTTGRANMSVLEKIVYIADVAEPGRKFLEAQEIKDLSFKDLNKAIVLSIKYSIKKLIEADRTIDSKTIECYNYYSSQTKNTKLPT